MFDKAEVLYKEGKYTEAVQWYRKATEQGDEKAQYKSGYCYFHGEGVKEDDREAIYWFQLAAEQVLPPFQYP